MRKPVLCLLLVLALGAPALLYVWLPRERTEPPVAPVVPPREEPAIRYPIETVAPAQESANLPTLIESDATLRDALVGLLGQSIEQVFNFQEIIRRVVATVDNLPHEHVSPRLMPVKPVPGQPMIAERREKLVLSTDNAARYDSYVRLVEAAPTAPLVALYVQFYPLFQEQYEELGHPGNYFNDRVVQVIDHLLAAPDVRGPVALTQPKVLYQFADPELESLSAGQKILVRVGSENAAKIKTKLREIRGALVSNAPAQ